MSAWSWLKLRLYLWLLRKAAMVARWVLLVLALAVAWPVTLVAAIGVTAAWVRGWPAVRLYRTAAWALPVAAVWLTIVEVLTPGWHQAALIPGRAWNYGLQHPGGAGLLDTYASLVPAGLALGGLAWAWRTYAMTAGVGGWTASAPISFDLRPPANTAAFLDRIQRAAVADPDLVRQLEVGQACYIQGGTATFVQVARPKASPLTLLGAPAGEPLAQVPEPRRAPDPGPPAWPHRPASLDDVFGPGDPR